MLSRLFERIDTAELLAWINDPFDESQPQDPNVKPQG
jgi:hypothetical protein